MNSFARYLSFALVLVVIRGFGQTAAAPTQPVAQTAPAQSASAKVEMPSDPAALLALAAKKNGLQNAGSAPWHLKATYELLDDKGAVKETGTFEEFWVSEKLYKLSYTSPSFSQSDYSNEKGLFRTGSREWPDEATGMVRKTFFPPFPSEAGMAKYKVKMKEETLGGTPLKCVTVDMDVPAGSPLVEMHYLTKDAPIQRIGVTLWGTYETVYNQMSMFRGIYLARDMKVARLNKPLVHVHIDALESLPKIDEATLTPPPEAVSITRRVVIPVLASSQATATKLISKPPPEYPADAKGARIQGTVLLRAVIGKDGRIVFLQVLSGPPKLQQATLDAVRQWVYQPYLVDGEPVEVETEIHVVFSLGG
jgi:TonB family protein